MNRWRMVALRRIDDQTIEREVEIEARADQLHQHVAAEMFEPGELLAFHVELVTGRDS